MIKSTGFYVNEDEDEIEIRMIGDNGLVFNITIEGHIDAYVFDRNTSEIDQHVITPDEGGVVMLRSMRDRLI